MNIPAVAIAALFLMVSSGSAADATLTALRVHPPALHFRLPEAAEQLLVFGRDSQLEREIDQSRQVRYSAAPTGIVDVSASGRVSPLADGAAVIRIEHGTLGLEVPVVVNGLSNPEPISFRRDVSPILTKASCNAGGCHGKAEGQNGFKLSVFGFDPAFDHRALVVESGGRRVFPAVPAQSLLLRKALAQVPHGGGRKLEVGSLWHRRLQRWIQEGVRFDDETFTPIRQIQVSPAVLSLASFESQQLRVEAVDEAGLVRCVTAEAEFQSNQDAIVSVDRDGVLTASDVPGEAAILVRYQGHVTICRVTRPRPAVHFERPPENNAFDGFVWDKLERLRIPASPLSSDAEFLRRVFLDTIGTLPTADEARTFLDDTHPSKRSQLIANLLKRPEYNDYWTQRWADLLQVDRDLVNPAGAVAMTRWIHTQMERNTPFHEFARQILLARGSTYAESPAAFFRVQKDAERASRAVSQLFLGIRIECAQCHHHPFEKWDQSDYYALAGFFSGVDAKPQPDGSHKILLKPGVDLKHPRTDELVPAAAFGAPPADFTGSADRREQLAQWLTSRENLYFQRTIVNRLWAHYFGRGLVEPIDDLRATNPASNEPLLQALCQELVARNYDLRALTQRMLETRAYQLSSQTLPENQLDEQNYSHAIWKPIPAEVLLDAVSQVTESPEPFNGWPVGYRAIQIWDNKLPSDFLQVFGRPSRLTVCACERGIEPSMAQALHLMNSDTTSRKLTDRRGRIARLAQSDIDPEALIEECYLAALSRRPHPGELTAVRQIFETSVTRHEAVEDTVWMLLNLKEFVFNH